MLLSISLTSISYAKNATPSITEQDAGKLLGWVADPDPKNICHGYYEAKQVSFPSEATEKDTVIRGNSASYTENKPSILHDAHVLQPGRELTADQAYSTINPNNWRTSDIHLLGNIRLNEAGFLAIADTGKVNVANNTAELGTVIYRLTQTYLQDSRLALNPKKITDTKNSIYTISDLTAHGDAKTIEQKEPKIINLYDASYSTCSPETHTWTVKASKIILNRNTGTGTAVNMILYAHKIPVFYFPYFNFPIDLQRKSGFLYPSMSTSGSSGTALTIPYYWNIAPNYDDTITSTYYTDRGIQVNNLFNYLSWNRMGQFYFSALPNDHTFARFQNNAENTTEYTSQPGYERLANDTTNREFFSWQDQYIINANWTSAVNLNYSGDDYYFQDFSTNQNDILQDQMLQLGNLNYDSPNWHMSGLVENYQTLHPVNNTAVIPDQYAHYPQLDFNADYPEGQHFNYQTYGEFVNFRFPLMTENYQANLPSVIGQRYDLKPEISLPFYDASYHFVPTIEYDATAYNLADVSPNQPNTITRGLPIFNVDTGLYYQRSFTAFDNSYNQTFEPRAFYLYVPDENQDNIPLFDTAAETFTYDSVFQTNRFSGVDRIGDADQVGYGVTSRLINNTSGLDRFDASIGQIVYFKDREVNIGDLDNNLNPTNKLSPLVGQLRFQFLQNWFAVGDVSWQNSGNYITNGDFDIQYIHNNQNVFSIGYNYLKNGDPLPNEYQPNSSRNNLNQIQVAQAWQLNQRWSIYNSINYNISHHYTQTYLYGLAYNSCCWEIRVVATRSLLGLDTHNNPNYDSGIALQFALKGLSNIGASPHKVLNNEIPGYVDEFGKDRLPSEQPYVA